jgi:hypothetical protein
MEMKMNADQKIEISMYGMTAEQLRAEVENSMYISILKDVDLLVMSMLSDAQEMVNYSVSRETLEQQRQLLNRAKFVLRYYVMDKEVA